MLQPNRVYGSYKKREAERLAREERERKAAEERAKQAPPSTAELQGMLSLLTGLTDRCVTERNLKVEERRRKNGGW